MVAFVEESLAEIHISMYALMGRTDGKNRCIKELESMEDLVELQKEIQ